MLITNFAGGEVSKNLYGRIDLPIYQMSVSRLDNFTVMKTGGISRRCGTQNKGKLKGKARLIPFVVNNTLSFIFEIGNEYIRIWKNGQLLTIAGSPIEFAPTGDLPLYKTAELFDIQYAQTHDSLYLVHRHYKPYVIKWNAGDSFTLSSLAITGNAHNLPFQGQDEYPGCVAIFNGRLILANTLKNPQKVWASKVFEYENFTYFDTVVSKSIQLKNPNLQVFSATATQGSVVLTNLTKDLTSLENINQYYISGHDGVPSGTKVVSVTQNTMTLSNSLTASKEDMILSIHLWKNADTPTSEDYEEKEVINNLTHPGHAFSFEIGSDKNDAIKWLATTKDLIIGTESAEWIMGENVTAVNVNAQIQSRYGVSAFQASLVGHSLVYIAAGGRAVKNYMYDYEGRSYRSIDVTQTAQHLFSSAEAVDFDYTRIPDTHIFITRGDGVVCDLLYDDNNGISAWSKILLASGAVRNTVTCPSDTGYDDVFFAVERGGAYYLEKLDRTTEVYLDGFSSFTAETNEAEYQGAQVYIPEEDMLYALAELPDTYRDFTKEMYIGYQYESVVESLPVINDATNSKKRIVSLLIRFLDSHLPYVSQCNQKEEEPHEEEPFSGVIAVPVMSHFERDVFFKIRCTKPAPCTVLAVNAQLA